MAIDQYPKSRLPISNAQWRYNATGGETSLSGYDSFGQPLAYTVNNEQLYLNGVMLVRNVDYTASTGTTITGLTALSAGDFVEILTYSNFNVTTIPAPNITGSIVNSQLNKSSIVLGGVTINLGDTVSTLSGLTIDGTQNTIHTNRGATNPATATAGDLFWNTTTSALQLYTGSAWISFAPPAAPTIGSAVDAGTSRAYNNASASISFTPNLTAGTATSYFITSTPGSLTSYGTSSPIVITGLTSGTSYTFTVTAQGSFGNSIPSSATGAMTATTVPQAPTIGSATAVTAGASITFTPGNTGGKAISTYTVTSSSGATATGSSSPITVTEGTIGSYNYYVTATNANGTSVSSGLTNSVTPLNTITGGTLTSDATYYYRTFLGNGTLSTSYPLSVDALVIAGGGGSGYYIGGGGGSGGVLGLTSQNINGSASITVGAGGAIPSGSSPGNGGNGSTSQIGSLSAASGGGGGGGGEGGSSSVPGAGGSGGGGGRRGMAQSGAGGGANGVAGQGNKGGDGSTSGSTDNYGSGGGGGGAGAAGGSASGTTPGNGGAGTTTYSTWLTGISSAMSGVSGWSTATTGGYIGGGGGGGAYATQNSVSTGGSGGGGQGTWGGSSVSATPGVTNTGSGGGCPGYPSGTGGTTGGSGLVVIRYTRASVGG
jgi:hypothetical protein